MGNNKACSFLTINISTPTLHLLLQYLKSTNTTLLGNRKIHNVLFYLLQHKPRDAPLLLWLQGGPGLSSLFGQFLEIGPLGMNDRGHLFIRNASLNTRVNVVYLDQPVGAGFSYTKGLLGYAKDLDDVAEGVLEFLKQFLKMFPEYKNREFYVGGESYGGE
ncbi:hypothetical protein HPB48_004090 [Haemaphysalis longicornis]|uniref:Carboxypeptidase n=1 Tax=Haemaphysalis longicornis TaxID=44386 RepID=A0A9J6FM34_HAELO|nr:hypothetical protein HPB48_004090 [Haemaphysalis longicornis]